MMNGTPGSTKFGKAASIEEENPEELRKRLKDQEKRIMKFRTENQSLKTDLEKAHRLIAREVGEGANVDELLRQESQWRGRAQKIEVLKSKLQKIKLEFGTNVSMMTGISGGMSVATGAPKTNVERSLMKMDNNRARELEKANEDLASAKDALEDMERKYKGAVSRKTSLENELKEIKFDMQKKIKILLEKTENDDKLIRMLKEELSKGEGSKGAKSGIVGRLKNPKGEELVVDKDREIYRLRNEIAKLRNDASVLEAELQQKDAKVKELMKNCVGAPDEKFEEKEMLIAELEEQNEKLRKEIFWMTHEGEGAGKRKGKDENEKLVKELSKQNAQYRLKITQLQEQLDNKTRK